MSESITIPIDDTISINDNGNTTLYGSKFGWATQKHDRSGKRLFYFDDVGDLLIAQKIRYTGVKIHFIDTTKYDTMFGRKKNNLKNNKTIKNTMDSFTDAELIKKYKDQNSQKAFKELYNRYRGKLFGYVFNMVKDVDMTKEIIQQTYFKLITKIDKYTEEGVFGAWIYTIAYNTTIDHFRKNKRFSDVQAYYGDNEFFETLEYDYNPEKEYINKEQVSKINEHINNLDDNQKHVVNKRIEKELFKDISDDMGSNINTTLGRMRYARKNLSKMMSND